MSLKIDETKDLAVKQRVRQLTPLIKSSVDASPSRTSSRSAYPYRQQWVTKSAPRSEGSLAIFPDQNKIGPHWQYPQFFKMANHDHAIDKPQSMSA